MDKEDPDYQKFEDAKQKVRDLQEFLKENFIEDECDGSQPYCASCTSKRAVVDLELVWNLLDV